MTEIQKRIAQCFFEEVISIKTIKKKHSRENVMFVALGHDVQIRRQNGFVNQACQLSMIWPIGDCIRI